jgi:N12 class adenine-specific DNA methylase
VIMTHHPKDYPTRDLIAAIASPHVPTQTKELLINELTTRKDT